MMNWKGFGSKRTWSNVRYFLRIYLEGLRKTMKICAKIAGLQAEI
jgi:hypothetical protein